jgi:hypothetical protein
MGVAVDPACPVSDADIYTCEVPGCGQVAKYVLFWREEYRCQEHYDEHNAAEAARAQG